jgi:hypothetical protein
MFAHMGAWGRRHLAVSEELSIRAQVLEEGGPALWDAFMEELRETHLGIPRQNRGPSVAGQLQAAYESVASKGRRAD